MPQNDRVAAWNLADLRAAAYEAAGLSEPEPVWDGPDEDDRIYLASSEEERFNRELEAASEEERAEMSRRFVIHCGDGSPSQDKWVRGMAAASRPDCHDELLRSIGDLPPRPPTRGEREMGQRDPIGNVSRWLAYRRERRVVGRTATACPHRGSTRERRPGTPRRSGSRRATSTRAGPSSSDDPPPPEPHLAPHPGPIRRRAWRRV